MTIQPYLQPGASETTLTSSEATDPIDGDNPPATPHPSASLAAVLIKCPAESEAGDNEMSAEIARLPESARAELFNLLK